MIWHGTDICLDSLLDTSSFPSKCPNCRHTKAHIYLRADTSQRGGLWTWCSNCKVFEHASIIPPSYWENDDFINKNQLCAVPDYLEAHKNKIDEYMTQNYRGLDFDKCIGCMRYTDFSKLTCPRCRCHGISAWLENRGIIVSCKKCGYSVTGASFYAPCEKDRALYNILIQDKLSPSLIIKLNSFLHLNALDIKRTIETQEVLQINLNLTRIMAVILFLTEKNISHQILPPLRYSKLFSCTLKI